MGFLVTLKNAGKLENLFEKLAKSTENVSLRRKILVLVDQFLPDGNPDFYDHLSKLYRENAHLLSFDCVEGMSQTINILSEIDITSEIGTQEESERLLVELVGEALPEEPKATDPIIEGSDLAKAVKKRKPREKKAKAVATAPSVSAETTQLLNEMDQQQAHALIGKTVEELLKPTPGSMDEVNQAIESGAKFSGALSSDPIVTTVPTELVPPDTKVYGPNLETLVATQGKTLQYAPPPKWMRGLTKEELDELAGLEQGALAGSAPPETGNTVLSRHIRALDAALTKTGFLGQLAAFIDALADEVSE